MKIIIAPTKKMQVDLDSFPVQAKPEFLQQAKQLQAWMKSLDYQQLKNLWHCSDKLARENYQQLQIQNLDEQLTPAILAYIGIQYQYMAPDLFTQTALDYIQANLRILSGFYGILRPFDGIARYRLEMQSKVTLPNDDNLYEFWQQQIFDSLAPQPETIINLASVEYAKAITPYLRSSDHFITCLFGELQDGKVKQKATAAKMARGEMVRFMAEHQIEQPRDLKKFDRLNYQFSTKFSDENTLVFLH